MTYNRYGVFYTPPPGALASFGAAWLGWDIETGCPRAHPQIPGLLRAPAAITETPRRYGFHATLKSPFRLARHATQDGLITALAALCAELPAVPLSGMKVGRIGRLLALVPQGDTAAADALAAALLRRLDSFRAACRPVGLARRRAAGLNPAQEALLARWGYPFVLDQFRFHMTLTGRLGDSEIATVQHVLTPVLARLLPGGLRINDVTLAGEDDKGRFQSIQRFALGPHP